MEDTMGEVRAAQLLCDEVSNAQENMYLAYQEAANMMAAMHTAIDCESQVWFIFQKAFEAITQLYQDEEAMNGLSVVHPGHHMNGQPGREDNPSGRQHEQFPGFVCLQGGSKRFRRN